MSIVSRILPTADANAEYARVLCRPDLFQSSSRHGSGYLYQLQPALTAQERDEARVLLRSKNPFSSIGWYGSGEAIVVYGVE